MSHTRLHDETFLLRLLTPFVSSTPFGTYGIQLPCACFSSMNADISATPVRLFSSCVLPSGIKNVVEHDPSPGGTGLNPMVYDSRAVGSVMGGGGSSAPAEQAQEPAVSGCFFGASRLPQRGRRIRATKTAPRHSDAPFFVGTVVPDRGLISPYVSYSTCRCEQLSAWCQSSIFPPT